MRLSRPLIAFLLLGFAALSPLRAFAQSTSPYTVVVPVSDTSEAQRDQAFSTALAQVLARVSGGQDLRSNPGYSDALKNAPGMVQQYQYQRATGASAGLLLQTTFDSGAIRRAIAQMGASSAGVKPPVLLLVHGVGGSLLGQDALAPLASAAGQRGYNVVYADNTAALPDMTRLAAADPSALASITGTYHTGLVLLGQLRQGGADWTLLSGGKAQHWADQAGSTGAILSDAGNVMADRLGRQLNVIAGSTTVEGTFWVSGLTSARDYAGMLSALRADPSVLKVVTVGAQDDGALLDVKSSLALPALAADLAAGGQLLQAPPHQGADVSLRWLH
ncbi:DUF2066 domain-containing protein [Dyella sp. A6]|uniref:DUF2066 domain-containing protein n=1 Tax=Dyella aluminiiresistens TaxID=3069105 RepID=UPI002E7761C9|nr:DUF2066 domain-containing protein [Dyella sp. A6]